MKGLIDALRTIALEAIRRLEKRPAYILIFGTSSIFTLAGLIAIVAGVFTKQNATPLLMVGFSSFMASLIAAVIVIRLIDVEPPKQAIIAPTAQTTPGVPDVVVVGLRAITENLRQACGLNVPVLTEEIESNLADWKAGTGDWANGKLKVSGRHYRELLLRVYDTATENVFSTSDTHYLSAWKSDFGTRILEAHARSSARVTRVFVFDERKDVSKEDYDEIARHARAARITAMVYFDKEFEFFDFPPEVLRDFTIVDDGAAIGITLAVSDESIEAEWFFRDSDKREKYLLIREKLLNGAKSFAEFDQWWREERKKSGPKG